MRQIVLDTETTGLEVSQGHRIIEIGCIELIERRPSGRTFHHYCNPGRAIDAGALAVHRITAEFLADKPAFAELVEEWLAFIEGAELLIHNAAFDVAFLDAELARAGAHYGRVADHAEVIDTLALARTRYPGQKNSLDALCKRLGVDNSHREYHGALLDAQLLAEVYLAMTAGQATLALTLDETPGLAATAGSGVATPLKRPCVLRADAAECAAHEARLDALDKAAEGGSVWRRLLGH